MYRLRTFIYIVRNVYQTAPSTFRDLLVSRNASRCHAVPPTLQQVRFDERIIRLSRSLIRLRVVVFPRRRWHFIPRRASPPPGHCRRAANAARVPLRACKRARYSLVSFSEVQALDISRCRRESQPVPARRYYLSLSPRSRSSPSPLVRGTETKTKTTRRMATEIEERSRTRRSENTLLKLSLSAKGSPRRRRSLSR